MKVVSNEGQGVAFSTGTLTYFGVNILNPSFNEKVFFSSDSLYLDGQMISPLVGYLAACLLIALYGKERGT